MTERTITVRMARQGRVMLEGFARVPVSDDEDFDAEEAAWEMLERGEVAFEPITASMEYEPVCVCEEIGPTLYVRIEDSIVPCSTLQHASALCCAWIAENDLDSSCWDGGEVYDAPPLATPRPEPCAIVSYNGRIWKPTNIGGETLVSTVACGIGYEPAAFRAGDNIVFRNGVAVRTIWHVVAVTSRGEHKLAPAGNTKEGFRMPSAVVRSVLMTEDPSQYEYYWNA